MAAKEGFRKYTNPWRHRKTPHEMVREPLATDCEVNRTHIFQVVREKVAIVFVPGIMGSRIVNHKNKMIWNTDDAEFMLRTYFRLKPEGRYKLFFSNPLKVASDPTDAHKNYPKAQERDWPGVSWRFYGRLLQGIQDWNSPLKVLLDMPVHAFGYNWLKSNEESGMLLREKILKDLKDHKVILVTHSMGGLVARYALGGEGGEAIAENVLGVIHCAQPVHGAPDAYHRQICGFEGSGFFESRVLGKSGPDVTAVFPHSPGALQLLPSRHYRTNDGKTSWLHVQDPMDPTKYSSYPKEDPYEEIYLKSSHRDFWGMIHGEWFQPNPENQSVVDRALSMANQTSDTQEFSGITDRLARYLEKARDFHDTIGDYAHPRTIQLFSSGRHKTLSEVCWQTREITKDVLAAPTDYHPSTPRPLTLLRDIPDLFPSNRYGSYVEVRRAGPDGNFGEAVPPNERLSQVQREIREKGLRLFRVWISQAGERGPGMAAESICHLGDGTVPQSSATAMDSDLSGWEGCVHLLPMWKGPDGEFRAATGLVNQAEHAEFFDARAIETVKRIIHNLCLGWLKGDFA
jgi:hypothetical protein